MISSHIRLILEEGPGAPVITELEKKLNEGDI